MSDKKISKIYFQDLYVHGSRSDKCVIAIQTKIN